MSQRKAERLLNLHIMLLGSRRFVTKQHIRDTLYAGYPHTKAGDDAFERSFERDKDDLRAIGALIEVGSNDVLFDDEIGYRIPTEQTSLPEVRFEADEAAVLGLAARTWRQATLASAAESGRAKLVAAGVDIDAARLDVVTPALGAEEPSFDQFWEATQQRRVATFSYRRTGQPESRRRLQPWGVLRASGRWYVVGHDLDRGERRVFRLSRVVGDVQLGRQTEAYEVPPDTDVRAIAASLDPEQPRLDVSFLVRAGTAQGLRRHAHTVESGVSGPTDEVVWDRVVVQLSEYDAANEALAHGPDVVVESPAAVRDAVVARLRTAVGEDA
ncbi:MAG: helix-turn-helix transcriptional regulator [Nocardioides sp.]|uniref:helix-turn-helix transcriptional regulator n=1 Tax=Nocardioides sp. TaxID=35761 RepID=UPI003EFC89BF